MEKLNSSTIVKLGIVTDDIEDTVARYARLFNLKKEPVIHVPDPNAPAGSRKKQLPLGVVMDERIATGIEYSRFFAAFERYLKKPELLEGSMGGAGVLVFHV